MQTVIKLSYLKDGNVVRESEHTTNDAAQEEVKTIDLAFDEVHTQTVYRKGEEAAPAVDAAPAI